MEQSQGQLPLWLSAHVAPRTYTLSLLLLTTVCMFADQNLMSPNLSVIADEFGIPNDQKDARLGGDIAIAFFVVGAPFAIVVGWYTDRYPRHHMFAGVALLGAHGCLFTFFVTTHSQLLMARALTGLSIGGAAPILFSLLSDLYPARQRNLIVAGVGFSMSFGAACGQSMAGFMAHKGLGWKLPFLAVAVPLFILGVLVYCTVQDPPRAAQETSIQNTRDRGAKQVKYNERASWEKVVDIFRRRTNILLFLQGIPGCVPWGVISSFLNDYLSHERGKSQYCTPVGPSISIPTVNPHIKGKIWVFCVVTLEYRGPWVPTGPLLQ